MPPFAHEPPTRARSHTRTHDGYGVCLFAGIHSPRLPVRIVYVTETYPPEVNGVALTVARAVSQLRERGHALTLMRPRQPGEAPREDADEWRTSGMPLPMYRQMRLGLASAAALRERLQALRPQLVHVATPGPLGAAAVHAARALSLPVTTDYRTNFQQYSGYYGFGWMAPTVQRYLRRFHNLGQRTFAPTGAVQAQLQREGFRHVHVVGRGVDTELFSPVHRSDSLRFGSDAPILLYVGRLAAEKNVTLALEAYEAVRARRPDARMLVVGDGPQRRRLRARCPTAFFVGELRGPALAAVYASADLFIFPSLSDTFGNVTLEAMASGLPVVAFDTAAAAEHLRGSEAAGLAAPGDSRAFVEAACAMASLPLHELRRRGTLARQRALGMRWERVLGQFEHQLVETAEGQHAAQASSAASALVA